MGQWVVLPQPRPLNDLAKVLIAQHVFSQPDCNYIQHIWFIFIALILLSASGASVLARRQIWARAFPGIPSSCHPLIVLDINRYSFR